MDLLLPLHRISMAIWLRVDPHGKSIILIVGIVDDHLVIQRYSPWIPRPWPGIDTKLGAHRLWPIGVGDLSYLLRCSRQHAASDGVQADFANLADFIWYLAFERFVLLDLVVRSFVVVAVRRAEADEAFGCILNWISNVISILWFFLILVLDIQGMISSRWQLLQGLEVLKLLLLLLMLTRFRNTCRSTDDLLWWCSDIGFNHLLLWLAKWQSTSSIAALVSINGTFFSNISFST